MAVQLPDSTSLERTEEVIDHIIEILPDDARRRPHRLGRRPIVRSRRQRLELRQLLPHARRFRQTPRPGALQRRRRRRLRKRIAEEIPEAKVTVLGPPPVFGLGAAGGFKFMVEDRSGDNDLRSCSWKPKSSSPRASRNPR